VLSFTSPFVWLAGLFSEVNRNLPFILNMFIVACGGVLVFLAARHSQKPLDTPQSAETA